MSTAEQERVRQLKELFADAPEMAKTALANALPALTSQASDAPDSHARSAGRIGIRQGTVSELTVIAPFGTRRSQKAARRPAPAERQL